MNNPLHVSMELPNRVIITYADDEDGRRVITRPMRTSDANVITNYVCQALASGQIQMHDLPVLEIETVE